MTGRLAKETPQWKVEKRPHRRKIKGWKCDRELTGPPGPALGEREPQAWRRERNRLLHRGDCCAGEDKASEHLSLETREAEFQISLLPSVGLKSLEF